MWGTATGSPGPHPRAAREGFDAGASETVVSVGPRGPGQMPDCDYCEQSFGDEGSLLEHMGDAHEGELGRIDQRRVEEHYGGDGEGLSTTITYAIVGIVIVAVIGGAVYAAVAAFGGGEQRVHEHGTINVTVDGEPVDFQQSQYLNAQGFHFHPGNPQWHMHPAEPGRLTLADAMSRLGIEVTETSITVEGETYDEAEGATIAIEVNGEPVDPGEYELHEDDHVRIAVQTDA
jgi:sulfur carrier protein ThiS